jgi:hypothetical protein
VNRTVVSLRFASLVAALVSSSWLYGSASLAQTNTDQTMFGEENQLLKIDQNQKQQLLEEKQQYQEEVQQQQASTETYREYAEKRIAELTKLKNAGGSPVRKLSADKNQELYALEKWMQADAQARTEEQKHIQQIDQAISNLSADQTTTIGNMHSAVSNLRENDVIAEENRKFNQQMQINNFNELQTEMGWLTNNAPPRWGTMGGGGGYGGYGGGGGYGSPYFWNFGRLNQRMNW